MNDYWTTAAAMNDALVANFLLKLKHSRPSPTRTAAAASSSGGRMVPFRWGRRKVRSSSRPDVTRFAMSKERATRSPTTPLSWSGGCGTTSVSGSGYVDGLEASSSLICRRSVGSKITSAAFELANSKKTKGKKTYNELKKEECLLLDERLNLKMDLANMHATLTHHKLTNQKLKRIKSMNVRSGRMTTAVAVHPVGAPMQAITSFVQIPAVAFKAQDSNNKISHPSLLSFSSSNSAEAEDSKSFMLPDLNMVPSLE